MWKRILVILSGSLRPWKVAHRYQENQLIYHQGVETCTLDVITTSSHKLPTAYALAWTTVISSIKKHIHCMSLSELWWRCIHYLWSVVKRLIPLNRHQFLIKDTSLCLNDNFKLIILLKKKLFLIFRWFFFTLDNCFLLLTFTAFGKLSIRSPYIRSKSCCFYSFYILGSLSYSTIWWKCILPK